MDFIMVVGSQVEEHSSKKVRCLSRIVTGHPGCVNSTYTATHTHNSLQSHLCASEQTARKKASQAGAGIQFSARLSSCKRCEIASRSMVSSECST